MKTEDLQITLSEALRKLETLHRIEGHEFELGSHRLVRDVQQAIRHVMTELANPDRF